MGNERIPTRIYDDVASTSSTIARMNEGSRKRKAPSSPIPDDNSHSPLVVADDKDDEGREDEEEEKENGGDEIDDEEEGNDEEENGISPAWPKSDDCELFKRIRKACPKDDAIKYESRVNHLNWESIKFQDYSAEECKNRWLHVQTHLRNYRILAEVLEDAESWVDGPCYNNLNKRRKNNQKCPDDQPKKPRTSYMLPSMKPKDAVLEKPSGLEVKNVMAPKTLISPALAASSQLLFKAGKMTEPLKPPTSAAAYYVMTHKSRFGERTPDEIDFVWIKLSVEKRKKWIEEHSKKYEDYVLDMIKFAQTLNPAELRSFRIFMKNRARGLEDGDKNSQCTSASLKSSEGSSDSPPKKPASSADSKSAKSPSKIQPSVNANVKSSTEKEVASQSLFKAGKMTEPLKPPASAVAYYVMTHHSKLGNLTPAEIDALWVMLPEKEKKKCIEEHKKKHEDYVRDFEKFIRILNPAELRSYRTIMKIRARDEEEEVQESSDEESSDEERNDEERML
ncbi:nucleolar transcription factor 1-like isoform X2 [Daphnia pulex]|nr:nucleolar transcription factor 1-like isoform X2 [Daphnia pulex]XP_046452885.1 nucleolar transcription factor 1-like isoform X2 [Daphnia pulex]XP_046452886.1 nucleolar transcription factor 1-like isoform X2 [Daphnia pulex]